MRVLGIDLAWATNKKSGVSNETGVVAVLFSQSVRFGETIPVSLSVDGVLRLRIEASVSRDGSGEDATAVFGDLQLVRTPG